MTFSFVDRINELEEGRGARGTYVLPARLRRPPHWLLAEAIGQLAAWVAMERCGFRRRPVAALAGLVRLEDGEGEVLDLEAEIEARDPNTVVYRGRARLRERIVGELSRCVGPMLPMEEFDDPDAVRRRFALLRSTGVAPSDPGDPFERLRLDDLERRSGTMRATLRLPDAAPFFTDHFPRRPVLPATLLVDMLARLALELAADSFAAEAGDTLRIVCARNVKVRAFSLPGQVLQLTAKVVSVEPRGGLISVRAEADSDLVSTARVELGWREAP